MVNTRFSIALASQIALFTAAQIATAQPISPGQSASGQDTAQQTRLAALQEAERRRNQDLLRDRGQEELDARTQQLAQEDGLETETLQSAQARSVIDGVFTDPDELVSLQFPDAVTVQSLSDVFGRALGVNIIMPEQAGAQTVIFKASVTVPAGRLIPLLSSMLEDQGYTIIQESETIYRVVGVANAVGVVQGGELATTRIIPTPGVRASSIRDAIRETFQTNNVRISPIDDLGVIVVSGGAAIMNRIEAIIEGIIDARSEMNFYVLNVEHVSPSVARARMLELDARVNQPTTPGVQQNPANTASAASGSAVSSLADRLFIHVGNTLLFRGTQDEVQDINELLELVDQVSPLIAKPYSTGTVTLEVAATAEALGLGTPAFTGDLQSSPQQTGRVGAQQAQSNNIPAIASGSSMLIDLEIGRITFFGTETQHKQFDKIVSDFRKAAVDNGQQIRIYKLLYASADGSGLQSSAGTTGDGAPAGTTGGLQTSGGGIAGLLRDLITGDQNQTASGRFLPGSSNAQSTANQVFDNLSDEQRIAEAEQGVTRLFATAENTTIVADPARNQLIIKAPARAHEQLDQIISELDVRQPQVFIDIQIISVTSNDSFDWRAGVDLSFGQFDFFSDFGVLNPGTDGVLNGVPTAPVSSNSGLTTGIIKSDYLPIVINTIATLGDTRFLSQPQLLVNDNQPARYESISEVPFAETTQNANTTTTGQGGTAEAGTTVDVTPRISKAGEVTLDLRVELSSFTGPSVNGLQPPAQSDIYESLITLPANSTVIVGGFQTTTTQISESKIPILGDIPLLGNAFKSYSEDETVLTLYIFITPRVISSISDRGLHLLTEGPLRASGFDDGTPTLTPELIRVSSKNRSADQKTADRINNLLQSTGIGPADPYDQGIPSEDIEQDRR